MRPVAATVLVSAAVAVAVSACSSSAPRRAAVPMRSLPTSTPPGPTCSSLDAATVSAQLGLTVTGPTVRTNGKTTTCDFASGSYRDDVVVTVTSGASASAFAATATGLGSSGATTTSIAGIGDMAVGASVGSGPDQTNTVALLSGSVEVSVTAPAPLPKVEAVAEETAG